MSLLSFCIFLQRRCFKSEKEESRCKWGLRGKFFGLPHILVSLQPPVLRRHLRLHREVKERPHWLEEEACVSGTMMWMTRIITTMIWMTMIITTMMWMTMIITNMMRLNPGKLLKASWKQRTSSKLWASPSCSWSSSSLLSSSSLSGAVCSSSL